MSGFLRSPLEFMPQLGGCDDGGGEPAVQRITATGTPTDIGEIIWTPSQDIQIILNDMSTEDRTAVKQSMGLLQGIIGIALTTYIATTPKYAQADAVLAVVNRFLDNMQPDAPSD